MKIDRAWHFMGEASLPAEVRGPGPHELTLSQLEALIERYAVLLYKYNGDVTIAFDTHQGRFKTR